MDADEKILKRKRRWRTLWRVTKGTFAVAFITMAVAFAGATLWWQSMLDEATQRLPELPTVVREVYRQPTVILAADGSELFSMISEFREPKTIDEIPQLVIDATLAAEDRRFYEHGGVDPIAVMRILRVAAEEGEATQGASTLTMQISKRMFTGFERTLERKLKDMALATVIEQTWTKPQILEFYLNEVYYGSGAYGVAAAAKVYFDKDLEELTIGEAATLARLVRRPSSQNPHIDLEMAERNRNVVLASMLDAGSITRAEHDLARETPLEVQGRPDNLLTSDKRFPHFVDFVLSEARRLAPEVDLHVGGYRVETTLRPDFQTIAQSEVERTVSANRGRRVTQGAFVLMDRDGQILAMVGGTDYERNQFNNVTQGERQPGSAFKPFVYATAFEYGTLGPRSSISNARFSVRDGNKMWTPKGGGTGGSVSVTRALASSINVPAVRTIDMVGPANVVALSERAFGFTTDLRPFLSLALGSSEVKPIDMARAYSVFQLHGDRAEPFVIKSIARYDGQVERSFSPRIKPSVVSERTAADMDSILRSVVTSGTARVASGVRNARGKTGTTSDYKDAWFCGYTDELIGIGWVANEILSDEGATRYGTMAGVFGGRVVAPMWARIMKDVQEITGEESRRIPAPSAGGSRQTLPNPARVVDNDEDDEPTPGLTIVDDAPDPSSPAPNQFEVVDDFPARVPPISNASNPPAATPMVYVEICADTGMRASPYCPERVIRAFPQGQAPTGTCTVHGP